MKVNAGTSAVIFDKSKITTRQIERLKETAPTDVEFKENETEFEVYDFTLQHPRYMEKAVSLLRRISLRK